MPDGRCGIVLAQDARFSLPMIHEFAVSNSHNINSNNSKKSMLMAMSLILLILAISAGKFAISKDDMESRQPANHPCYRARLPCRHYDYKVMLEVRVPQCDVGCNSNLDQS